ncbi:hypothetical protein MNBD_GAMMA07-2245 [hydrothermal vent metagenome]|uniref:Uncharacterized protein n=1 Tax=hydrothermal vent metagenome TaxID=652676 RepID=A0A3B0WU89_9ZZZZ
MKHSHWVHKNTSIKLTLISLWLILQLFTMKAMAMQIEEPEYFLQLDVHEFPRMLVVNGVVIEKDQSGKGTSATAFPINHWIKNGENTLELHYGPENFIKKRTHQNSRCNVSIVVKGKVGGKKISYKVADLSYVPNYDIPLSERFKGSMPAGRYTYSEKESKPTTDKGDFSIGAVQADSDKYDQRGNRIYRTFTADVPFPKWAFFSADKIYSYPRTNENYDGMKLKVWPMLLKLWDLFESKKIDKILPLFEARSKELDMAYYREPGYSIKSFEHDLKNIYKAGYPLDRIDFEQMKLIVAYNEKLFTIANAADSTGTVMFYDKKDNTNTFFNMYWMKKDGKWSIIR